LKEYVGVAGQGVSGWLVATGLQPAGAGQMYAQLTGLGALLIAGLLLPWLIFKVALSVLALGRRIATVPAAVNAPVEPEPATESAAPAVPPDEPLPVLSAVPATEPPMAVPAEEPVPPTGELAAPAAEPAPKPRRSRPKRVSAAKKKTPL